MLCPSGQGPDSCRTLACLRCLRSYLNLSKPPNYRGIAKCLICHAEVARGSGICHKIYRVVDDIFDIMDDAVAVCKSAFKCRTCGKKCTSQQTYGVIFGRNVLVQRFSVDILDVINGVCGVLLMGSMQRIISRFVVRFANANLANGEILPHLRQEKLQYEERIRMAEKSLIWINAKVEELSTEHTTLSTLSTLSTTLPSLPPPPPSTP